MNKLLPKMANAAQDRLNEYSRLSASPGIASRVTATEVPMVRATGKTQNPSNTRKRANKLVVSMTKTSGKHPELERLQGARDMIENIRHSYLGAGEAPPAYLSSPISNYNDQIRHEVGRIKAIEGRPPTRSFAHDVRYNIVPDVASRAENVSGRVSRAINDFSRVSRIPVGPTTTGGILNESLVAPAKDYWGAKIRNIYDMMANTPNNDGWMGSGTRTQNLGTGYPVSY